MNLHSLETYLYKYVLPVFFFPWRGFAGWSKVFPSNPAGSLWGLVALWVVIYSFTLWYALRLKTVVLEDRTLYVKSYLKEIPVPPPRTTKSMPNIKAPAATPKPWAVLILASKRTLR
jgi:hypothetical protein